MCITDSLDSAAANRISESDGRQVTIVRLDDICIYHNNYHIWEIPRWIKDVNLDYKLYMRYNESSNGYGTNEYVLFAI